MSKIAVVFHSGYGHTKRMAEAVAEGAQGELIAIDAEGNLPEGGWEQLAAAKAMALAGRAPTLLVNCAALFREDTAATVTATMLDEHLAVNLTAPVLLTRALADLADGDAAVVHILDQRVLNPVPDQLSYTLSKQALHAAVRTLARSLAPRVRVNAVAPGLDRKSVV